MDEVEAVTSELLQEQLQLADLHWQRTLLLR